MGAVMRLTSLDEMTKFLAGTMQLDWGAPARVRRDAPSRPQLRATGLNHLVRASALVFGARARQTTAGAAMLPAKFNCMDSAKHPSPSRGV